MEELLADIKRVEELTQYIVYRDKQKLTNNKKTLKSLKKKIKDEKYDKVFKSKKAEELIE